MLARLDLILPFSVSVPEKEKFSIHGYHGYVDSGYTIRIYPPMKTTQPLQQDDSTEILINGKSSFQANGLRIYFQKDNFDRRKTIDCDPPYTLILRTINSFLSKLRFVTRNSRIRTVDFPMISWNLRYLNDDESELEESKELVRGRFARHFKSTLAGLDNSIWQEVFKLPYDYSVPKWEELILDAQEALPEIGPSIVLALTALEVFISHVLGELSKNKAVPDDLWEWLNNRQWWLQNPSTDEQFDVLLKILLGISLKENTDLWESYKNLKTARNSFIHEGIAKIGDSVLSQEKALQLLKKAKDIIKFVKEKLPKQLQWPEYKFSIKIEAKLRLL
jgi:hypothetical protein